MKWKNSVKEAAMAATRNTNGNMAERRARHYTQYPEVSVGWENSERKKKNEYGSNNTATRNTVAVWVRGSGQDSGALNTLTRLVRMHIRRARRGERREEERRTREV
ncbi:hypothetical protein E2C01_079272 [Portunus trituberculatus]|uniref:Uncharacterized protein n=1 Tax=Portunus trituberculatus TaxID=210409 RepID=A0A5B7IQ63_PORTR|nr:hypothetical protein [Portunus trituberculatus]